MMTALHLRCEVDSGDQRLLVGAPKGVHGDLEPRSMVPISELNRDEMDLTPPDV